MKIIALARHWVCETNWFVFHKTDMTSLHWLTFHSLCEKSRVCTTQIDIKMDKKAVWPYGITIHFLT